MDDDPLMFSAIYRFSYAAEPSASMSSSCSTPAAPENPELDPITGLQEPVLDFWYSDSPSPNTLAHTEVESESIGVCVQAPEPMFSSIPAFTLGSDVLSPDASFLDPAVKVSPKSSSFPMDLSNYVCILPY